MNYLTEYGLDTKVNETPDFDKAQTSIYISSLFFILIIFKYRLCSFYTNFQ